MAYIAGVDLSRKKRIEAGLTYIYGVGFKESAEILKATGVNLDTRVENLTEDDAAKIRTYIDKNLQVEGNLRRVVGLNIKRLIEINCYRGRRHRLGLPVRGQKTKTMLKFFRRFKNGTYSWG